MATKKINQDTLIEKYLDTLLLHPGELSSVYRFSKFIKVEEATFYQYFASFEAIESQVFINLFDAALVTLHDSKEYQGFDDRNKLLLFYYTYFENLKLNRSAIIEILGPHFISMQNEQKLKALKAKFGDYISTFNFSADIIDHEKLKKLETVGIRQASWAHFMMLHQYWIKDDSANFENTDILIEKSLNTGLNLMESDLLNQFFDLGKFLLKDKFSL